MEIVFPNRFWNKDYCIMCGVNLLVSTVIFMQFPFFSIWAQHNGDDQTTTFFCVSLFFVVGMFLLGPFSSYLVDAFRRKRVCELSILVLIVSTVFLWDVTNLLGLSVLCLIQGAGFSIFEMSLGSTLINDLSISKRRTATDYFFSWFGFLGLPLGVAITLMLNSFFTLEYIFYCMHGILGLALLLLFTIRVPFRAPINVSIISMDRFFHPGAIIFILNLLPVSILAGLFISGSIAYKELLMMFAGSSVGMLLHRLFFVGADNRADAVSGIILVMFSLMMLLHPGGMNVYNISFVMLGVGLGWFDSRLLLYFLKMSGHCQRGTLQQTFILTLITGNCIGYCISSLNVNIYFIGIILAILSLTLYIFVTHPWFLRIKGRDFKFKEI